MGVLFIAYGCSGKAPGIDGESRALECTGLEIGAGCTYRSGCDVTTFGSLPA
jgi:hypothetical protein